MIGSFPSQPTGRWIHANQPTDYFEQLWDVHAGPWTHWNWRHCLNSLQKSIRYFYHSLTLYISVMLTLHTILTHSAFIQWTDCRSSLFTEMSGDKWAAPPLMAWPCRIMTRVRQRDSEQVRGKVQDFWQSKDLRGCLLFYTWKVRRERRRRSGYCRGIHQSARILRIYSQIRRQRVLQVNWQISYFR